MLIWYGPLARLADAYHGLRDAMTGIPARPPAIPCPAAPRDIPPRRIATTAHREYLIRMAQDAFEMEHTRYEAQVATAARRVAAAEKTRDGALALRAHVTDQLAEATRPLTESEATQRRLAEDGRPGALIRRRREQERRRRVADVRARQEKALRELTAAEAALAAARAQDERHRDVAGVRVRRIHEHFERRIASYRRTLVRHHRDGAWLNHVIGVLDPTIPAWINNGIQAEFEPESEPPLSVPDTPDVRPLEPIHLGEVTSFGADEDEPGRHVHIDYYWAAPRHFALRRRDDAFELRTLVDEHGPYVGDRQARGRIRLGDGDSFEFGGVRYELSLTDEGGWLRRQPLSPSDLIVSDMSAKTGDQSRLTRMSVVQRSGTVMAILGPSGAGKTSLFFALMNELKPDQGEFYFGGRDVTTQAERFRDELGFVPQKDEMHGTLTVHTLLRYSDRLQRRASRSDRDRRIHEVLQRLRVERHAYRLVSTLSGGQLKRVSIAMELLRKPRLLMLDEPTSGLDAGLDREVMRLLSRYSAGDKGDGSDRALVIVITHTTNYLGYAQQLLVIARGGRPIFAGAPDQLRPMLTMSEYADVMDLLEDTDREATVDSLAADYLNRSEMVERAKAEAARVRQIRPTHGDGLAIRAARAASRLTRQLPVMVQRQAHLLIARGSTKIRSERGIRDWIWTFVKATLPLLTASGGAAIVASVAKREGLESGPSVPGALGLLTTVCIFAGQWLTCTDIVSEFAIIRRERRTGAVVAAVVISKWLVFAAVAAVQGALISLVFLSIKPGPDEANVLAPATELFVNLAALSVAAMTLGMLISTVTKKIEQAVLVNALVMIGEIALNGASTDLSGNMIGGVIAGVLPTRWGLAAAASSMDLTRVSPGASQDALWTHGAGQWVWNLTCLGILTALFFAGTMFLLRLRLRRPD